MLILSNMVKDTCKDFDPWTHQTMDTPDFCPKPWIHLVTTMHAPLSRGGYTPPVPSSTMDTLCFVPKPWIHLHLSRDLKLATKISGTFWGTPPESDGL